VWACEKKEEREEKGKRRGKKRKVLGSLGRRKVSVAILSSSFHRFHFPYFFFSILSLEGEYPTTVLPILSILPLTRFISFRFIFVLFVD
jgi:hypothetical protein